MINNKLTRIKCVATLGLSTVMLSTTGCQIENPYKVSDDSIPYYADIGIDEDKLEYKKELDAEDGSRATLYHKTIQLPDKKAVLEHDGYYRKFETAIKSSPAYNDGNAMDLVYPAGHNDLIQGGSLYTLHNDELVLQNFNFVNSTTLAFTVKNFITEDELDLGELGLTIYFYDESGDTIGVAQPTDKITTNPQDITISIPYAQYVKYMALAEGVGRYDNYYEQLEATLGELGRIQTEAARGEVSQEEITDNNGNTTSISDILDRNASTP